MHSDEVLGMSLVPSSNVAVHYERITGGCTLATLTGVYGFQRNGTTTAGPLLAIGTATYDGQGNFVASQVTDRNGTFGAPTNQTGTYAVNPDCTASASDTTRTIFSQDGHRERCRRSAGDQHDRREQRRGSLRASEVAALNGSAVRFPISALRPRAQRADRWRSLASVPWATLGRTSRRPRPRPRRR